MDKIQARKVIKSHIKKKGKSDKFTVTESLIMFWWYLLNKTVFDDKLSPPKRL